MELALPLGCHTNPTRRSFRNGCEGLWYS
jgi:hypothetical protein